MPQILLDSDNFAGTNGNTLSTYNANWVLQITAGQEILIQGTPGFGWTGSGVRANYRTGFTWTNDQWAEIKLDGTTLANVIGARVRMQADGTESGYSIEANSFGGSNYLIRRIDSGTATTLKTTSIAYAVNDVANIQIVGTVITILINGTTSDTYDTAPDGTKYSSGNPGIGIYDLGTDGRKGGTWKAGRVGAVTAEQFVKVEIRAAP